MPETVYFFEDSGETLVLKLQGEARDRDSNSKNRSTSLTLADFSAIRHLREVYFPILRISALQFCAPSYETWVGMSPGNFTLCLAGG